MPTFFQALVRIIQGKPVYTADDQAPLSDVPPDPTTPQSSPIANPLQPLNYDEPGGPEQAIPTAAQPETEESLYQKNNASTFPVAYVKRTMTRINGEEMQVYAYIVNNSRMPLDLHKIIVFEREEELKHFMRPGDDREFLIYEGPLADGTQNHEAILIYKTETGDYFEAIHDIRFSFNQATHTYSVDELRLRPPIRLMNHML